MPGVSQFLIILETGLVSFHQFSPTILYHCWKHAWRAYSKKNYLNAAVSLCMTSAWMSKRGHCIEPWRLTGMTFLTQKDWIKGEECTGDLFCFRCQFCKCQRHDILLRIALCRRRRGQDSIPS